MTLAFWNSFHSIHSPLRGRIPTVNEINVLGTGPIVNGSRTTLSIMNWTNRMRIINQADFGKRWSKHWSSVFRDLNWITAIGSKSTTISDILYYCSMLRWLTPVDSSMAWSRIDNATSSDNWWRVGDDEADIACMWIIYKQVLRNGGNLYFIS